MSDDMTDDSHDEPWHDEPHEIDDDPIHADSIGGPQDVRSPLDQLAQRMVGAVLELLRRANRFAAGVLIFSATACIVGYLLGIAALDGGSRTAWIVLGGLTAGWAIVTVIVAMWRLSAIGRASATLVGEVRSLIGGDQDSERTVIETVEVTEESGEVGVVQVSRQFFTLRNSIGDRAQSYPELALALASITRFPAMMALAVFIGFGFIAISMIFLLILIF